MMTESIDTGIGSVEAGLGSRACPYLHLGVKRSSDIIFDFSINQSAEKAFIAAACELTGRMPMAKMRSANAFNHFSSPDEARMIDGFTPFPADLAQRYRDSGYWLDQPLGDYFRDRCEQYSDRIAVIFDDERVTYGALNQRVERMARHFIRIGFEPLDRVILQLPNTPEFLYVYLGFQRIGVITLLALPPHRRNEIGHYVDFVDAVGYVAADRARDFSFVDMARDIQTDAPSLRHLLILGDDVPDGCISIRDLLATEPEPPVEGKSVV